MADAAASTSPAPTAETPSTGLTSAQVAERRSRGLANAGGERTSRSVGEILRANILTRFNFILGVLLTVILAVGQPQDALFGVVLVTNALIGIAQELRAKRTLDRLAVLSAPRVRVIRDGAPQDIAVADLVAGDLVDLRAGDRLEDQAPAEAALGALADDENRNTTLAAIGQVFPPPGGWPRQATVPFSSARKWSAASFAGHGTWVLGAPEMVLPGGQQEQLSQAAGLAASGRRVLVLARAAGPLNGDSLPQDLRAAALVLLAERLRSDAAETIAYFAAQGVALKVISGDSPLTVSAVAARAGMPHASQPVDARELPEDPGALGRLLEERSVFGRVTPQQKQAMVTALQARGHTVAMTGDGVNDVLALKLADIGIAMGSGAPATRAVAELVLLDSRFATLPGVVAEGRRVTANIERVANLFITKTVWATLLALAVGITLLPYPFLPRHLTIIDTLAIGIPSFFLALAPNTRRYLPGFTGRVLRFAIPAGSIIAAATFAAYALARASGLPLVQQRTAATLVALILSLCVLVLLAAPLTWRRILLVGAVLVGFVLLFPVPAVRRFYALQLPRSGLATTLIITALGAAALAVFWVLSRRRGRGPPPVVRQ